MNPDTPFSLSGTSNEDSLLLLRTATELSFNSILITGADRRIIYANPAFCNMTGYPLDELLGENPRMLQGPLTEQSVIDRMTAALQKNVSFNGSTINYRKNGRPYLVEWTISPICSASGELRYFISIQKDITQLHAEQSTGNLFAKAIDAAYDGIFITNADGVMSLPTRALRSLPATAPTRWWAKSPRC